MATGAPDFTNYVRPERTILGEGQERYKLFSRTTVDADGGTLEISFTVEAGERVNVAAIAASCLGSCIQTWYYLLNDTPFFWSDFDISVFIPFPESAAFIAVEGEEVGAKVQNRDTEIRTMSVALLGTIESI